MSESTEGQRKAWETTVPADLLPVPAAPDLPADRRRRIKDQLMREISKAPSTMPSARRFTLGPRTRGLVLPIVSTGLVAGFALAVVLGHQGETSSNDLAGGPGGRIPVIAPASDNAVVLLDRIARVASTEAVPQVRSDQFVYIKSKIAFTRSDAGKRILDPLHDREVWLAQDFGESGLLRENGQQISLGATGDDVTEYLDGKKVTRPSQADFFTPNYHFLASLPTDPDALLQKIYAAAEGHGTGKNSEAFTIINDLLSEQIAPPKVAAALYRAAAKIPGVIVVPDTIDAAGRHGIAVARVELGERSEWIFDKNTLKYLGQRSYLVEDSQEGPKGMLTATTAVLARGVADGLGEKAVLIP